MLVYVVNKEGKPLMPCSPTKASKLLKSGKAKIHKYEPFTIQLLFGSSGYKQPITLGVDSGSKNVGIVAVTEEGKVLYTAEVELRRNIKELLDTRRMLRQNRRQRKTRYRKSRFLNRKREDGWLPPSIRSRIFSHVKLVIDVTKILPIKDIVVEVGLFDVQALMNPNIEGKEYQEGLLKGYDSVKEYVKVRDKYVCHYKDLRTDILCSKKLEVDHIIPKSKSGADRPTNLVCSCSEHNRIKGNMSYKEFTGKSRPIMESFKETAFMNVVKSHLVPLLRKLKPVTITYGYLTRLVRISFGLEKSHMNDSLAITNIKPKEYIGNSYRIKQVRKKKRSLHQMTPYYSKKGNPLSERWKKNTKEIIVRGKKWCLRDKVKVENRIGFISGFSSPQLDVSDIKGNIVRVFGRTSDSISTKYAQLICRNNNWQCCLV